MTEWQEKMEFIKNKFRMDVREKERISFEGCRGSGIFYWILLLLISMRLLISAVGIIHHGMWRDEVQAWLIARDSATPWAIVHNLRYDGHPILWYLLLWPITRITWAPDAMKVVTFLLSTITMGLLLWHGPWSRWEKALLPLGYYFIYEYGTKSRSYVLGMFLLAVACVLWGKRRTHIVPMSLVLGALANVHLYFGLMAAALAVALVLDRCMATGKYLFIPTRAELVAVGIFCGLGIFAAFVAAPPARGDFSDPVPIAWISVINSVGTILFPASYLVELGVPTAVAIPGYLLAEAASFALVILIVLQARNNWPVFAFLVISQAAVLGVFAFAYAPSVHHSGMLLLILVAGEWLRRHERQGLPQESSWRALDGSAGRLFMVMLGCQACIGIGVATYYLDHVHSNGQRAAEFIRARGWAEQPVAGVSTSFTTVCGYLRKPACYYADRARLSSYMVFDGRPGGDNPDKSSSMEPSDLDLYVRRASSLGEAVTLVVPYSWSKSTEIFSRYGFVEAQAMTGATVENYSIYRREPGSGQ